MCLYGITPQHELDFSINNPYGNVTDLDSYEVNVEDYRTFEASLGDFYARQFYKLLSFNMKRKVPVSIFKKTIMRGDEEL